MSICSQICASRFADVGALDGGVPWLGVRADEDTPNDSTAGRVIVEQVVWPTPSRLPSALETLLERVDAAACGGAGEPQARQGTGCGLAGSRQALERRQTEQFSQVQQLDTIAGEAAGGKRGFPDRPND